MPKTATGKPKTAKKSTRVTKPSLTTGSAEATTPISISQAVTMPRLMITDVRPCVDEGALPAKGVVNQAVRVQATIFTDGHNKLDARVLWNPAGSDEWHSYRLRLLGNDRWETFITPTATGFHRFKIEAWLDRWQNFHHELFQKFHAGVPVALEVEEGYRLLQDMLAYALKEEKSGKERGKKVAASGKSLHGETLQGTPLVSHGSMAFVDARNAVAEAVEHLGSESLQQDTAAKVEILLQQSLADAVETIEPKQFITQTVQQFFIEVERTAAGFASWYELFPRSITDSAQRHGTFDDVIKRLPAIRDMGFDVLYFPPIHPIGNKHRKGRNNSVTAQPGEPGSPYAIGSEEGGHDTVYSRLGGIDAFRRLLQAAREHNLEVAIDFAIQCAPDHPWLKQHPGWFNWRPDGTIRYAENPPKKYQDIVNVDFYAREALPDMWLAWRDIVEYWAKEGIRTFRVDNPHTKPLPFWQWLIGDIRSRYPDAIFLSEAFTRPAMMYQLAKIGFNQSYTYFIWRNTKREMTAYLKELSDTDVRDFYRPNFFVNTPDINPFYLQTSGRPGFLVRAALAATLSGLWGVYSGFELCESAALPGKEEYLDSEKYEIRPRDLAAPGNIIAEITRLNAIRKAHPALQTHHNVTFGECSADNVLYFYKNTPDNDDFILVAINLDPHQSHEAMLELPFNELGLTDGGILSVTELMRNLSIEWHGRRQHWFFDINEIPFAIWHVRNGRV